MICLQYNANLRNGLIGNAISQIKTRGQPSSLGEPGGQVFIIAIEKIKTHPIFLDIKERRKGQKKS